LRYHGYLGTSSTAKTAVAATSAGSNYLGQTMPLDTRLKTSDNYTLTLAGGENLGAADGSITHLIICPGNEAGDATSCASAAINDRGFGKLLSDTTDNVTRVFITPGATTSFELVTADNVGTADNVTATQAITDTKSTTTAVTLGTALTVVTEATGFSPVMDSLIHGSTLYTLTAKDNGTLTACTSGTCPTSASAVFVSTVSDRIVLDSDGTNMIGIADNGTNIAVYNLTTPGTPARVGANITTVAIGDSFCGAVGGSRVLVANDNSTDNITGGGAIFFNATAIDNSTGWDTSSTVAAGLDNSTVGVNCAMTYGGISGDNRTFYMVIDNRTSTLLYSIIDNTTALTVSLAGTLASTTADNLAIATDTNGVPYVVIDNATGGANLYRTTSLTPLGAVGLYGAVDVEVSSDNTKAGVAGISTDAATGYPAVRVWYNE
jgi:hypothetical protein